MKTNPHQAVALSRATAVNRVAAFVASHGLVFLLFVGSASHAQTTIGYYSYSVPGCGVLHDFSNTDPHLQCTKILNNFADYHRCQYARQGYTVDVISQFFGLSSASHIECKGEVRINFGAQNGGGYMDQGITQYMYKKPVIDTAVGTGPAPSSCASPGYGNPIFPLTGSKRDVVALGAGLGGALQAVYDTRRKLPSNDDSAVFQGSVPASFGELWESTYHRRLIVQSLQSGAVSAVQAARGVGQWISFTKDGSGNYTPPADVSDKLVAVAGRAIA